MGADREDDGDGPDAPVTSEAGTDAGLVRATSGTDTIADTPRTRATASNLAQLPARFTVKKQLGEGGMGTVVEAYDRVLSRDVAIKILARDHRDDPNVGTRFLREARAAARLRHPGIVGVHDIDPDGGYIVMELVRGESLSTRLWRERKLPVDEVRRIGSAMLSALAAAHAAGIVHRDVKPANVLLGDDGEVKLADFGVAYFGDSELTMPGTRVGTPAYMAPEQLRGKDVDARADVYSAGVTLFEAATGERPDDDDKLYDPYTKLVMATGDTALAEAVRRAIRERPADRYADGAAFLAGLEVTQAPSAPPPARAKFPTLARRSRAPYVLAVVAISLAIGGAGALYMSTRTHDLETAAAAPPATVTHRTVALLPFTDDTKNPVLDFAASGLPNLLGLELHGISDLTVLGYYQLQDVAGPNASRAAWLAAARKLGADLVVRGTLDGSGATIHVTIDVDTIDGVHVESSERDARVDEVPEAVRHAAPAVIHAALGRDTSAGSAAPTAFDVDRELQLGISELEREHLPEAADHLRAALGHAPDLAIAHYYLGMTMSWSAPPGDAAKAEIAKARASNALDEAQLGVLVGLEHIADLDYSGGIAPMLPLAEKFPDNRDILYVTFECLFHGGRPGEAMAMYHRIIQIAPMYRLALVHVLTYAISHDDEAGMAWGLSLNRNGGDEYNAIWESRVLVARRDYRGAIETLSRELDRKDAPAVLKNELGVAYALSDQLDVASSLATSLGETDAGSEASTLLGVATARGDRVAIRRWFEATIHAIAIAPPGVLRALPLALLVGAHLPVATRADLLTLSKALDATAIPTIERSLNRQLAQTFLAEGLDDRVRLDELAASPYPEVSELAHAAIARAAGDRATAATAMRRSIAATGDARFLVDQWWELAGDLHATGDHAATIAACDEVIRPRLVLTWAWGGAVGDCLAWTAEAHEALGHADDARAAWRRLAVMRSAAPSGDPLVVAAKAGLARLAQVAPVAPLAPVTPAR